MGKIEETPAFKRQIEGFLKANPKIKEAIDLFQISDEQYIRALRSVEPQTTTSNKLVIDLES